MDGKNGVQSRQIQTAAANATSFSQLRAVSRQDEIGRSQRYATTGMGVRKKKYLEASMPATLAAPPSSQRRCAPVLPSCAAALASATYHRSSMRNSPRSVSSLATLW
ncbi:MAG TPA: hypothetical protein VFF12_07930 [Myxococcaceae bacterium]|nr:hypothetical protein [Myxococcaceae bacterium]